MLSGRYVAQTVFSLTTKQFPSWLDRAWLRWPRPAFDQPDSFQILPYRTTASGSSRSVSITALA